MLPIQRSDDPFKWCWAFPVGFMNMDETSELCAIKKYKEVMKYVQFMLIMFPKCFPDFCNALIIGVR